MKTTILKITALSLFAAAIVAAPAVVRAQNSTNALGMSEAPVKHGKRELTPFHGKLSAIDTNAMTLTVGTRTFEITSETKITKDGQPAVLADGMVGEMAGGAYKKGADGKLEATTVSFGAKATGSGSGKKKKKSETPDGMGSNTNSATN